MGLWRELGFHVKIAKMEDQVGTMGAKREKKRLDWRNIEIGSAKWARDRTRL